MILSVDQDRSMTYCTLNCKIDNEFTPQFDYHKPPHLNWKGTKTHSITEFQHVNK